MIVLDPEHRLRSVEAQQRAGHEGIDLAIGGVVVGGDVDEIGPRMQHWPQRRVGEALVKAAIMLRRHVNGRQRTGAERLDLGELPRLRHVAGLAAGTHPNRARIPDHWQQRRRKSTGNRIVGLYPRDAVGNNDDAQGSPVQ